MPLGVTSFEGLAVHPHHGGDRWPRGTVRGCVHPPGGDESEPRFLPFKHRFQLAINLFLALPALVVVPATGLYQVDELGGRAFEAGLPTPRSAEGVPGGAGDRPGQWPRGAGEPRRPFLRRPGVTRRFVADERRDARLALRHLRPQNGHARE
jgi:hypothetical protein